MTDTIYGLWYSEAGAKKYFYVGVTTDTAARWLKHKNPPASDTSARAEFIRNLKADGIEYFMETLEVITNGGHDAEDLWITNLEAAGHKLKNSKRGDWDRFVDDGTRVSKSIDLTEENFLDNKNWSDKSVTGLMPGEKWAVMGGCRMFRKGWSYVRIYHGPGKGWWKTTSKMGCKQLYKNVLIDIRDARK